MTSRSVLPSRRAAALAALALLLTPLGTLGPAAADAPAAAPASGALQGKIATLSWMLGDWTCSATVDKAVGGGDHDVGNHIEARPDGQAIEVTATIDGKPGSTGEFIFDAATGLWTLTSDSSAVGHLKWTGKPDEMTDHSLTLHTTFVNGTTTIPLIAAYDWGTAGEYTAQFQAVHADGTAVTFETQHCAHGTDSGKKPE